MNITDDRYALRQAAGMVVVPGARYTSREFFDLEMERLWPRCLAGGLPRRGGSHLGDYLEYTIGDQSILIVRSDHKEIRAYFNACPHRGTRLASGVGASPRPRSGVDITGGVGASMVRSQRSWTATNSQKR